MKRKGVTIILLITVCAIIFYGYRYIDNPVETKTAKLTQIEDIITLDAYVAREERVYAAELTGTMYSYVSDGARVAKNMRITTVYRGNADNELVDELNSIDNKISQLEKEKEKSDIYTTQNSSAQSKIETVRESIINAAINKEISKIPVYKNSINAIYNKDIDTTGDSIMELEQRKHVIENRLGNDKSDIYSSMSGIYSKNVDGLEMILTPDNVLNFTLADYSGLTQPEDNSDLDNMVEEGQSICKVVDNHVWYAMTVMPKAQADSLKGKKNLLIRFENLPGTEVSASVAYISQEAEGEENAVVVFKSDRYLEGVYGIRFGKMDIVVNRYVGFEVPVYSLRIVDDKKGVLISKGTSEVFCECEVVYTNEESGNAIIYPKEDAKVELSVGDKIIIGEKSSG